MKKQKTEVTIVTDKKLLRDQYFAAKSNGSDLLQWCNVKASELGMSYGKFVNWLGI